MAALASLQAADAICVTNMANKTWVEAYSERDKDGTIKIRFLRWINTAGENGPVTDVTSGTFDTMNEIGAWDETDQDNVT